MQYWLEMHEVHHWQILPVFCCCCCHHHLHISTGIHWWHSDTFLSGVVGVIHLVIVVGGIFFLNIVPAISDIYTRLWAWWKFWLINGFGINRGMSSRRNLCVLFLYMMGTTSTFCVWIWPSGCCRFWGTLPSCSLATEGQHSRWHDTTLFSFSRT
jgi:hypothetical protein